MLVYLINFCNILGGISKKRQKEIGVELGGPKKIMILSCVAMIVWVLYLVITSMAAYKVIDAWF